MDNWAWVVAPAVGLIFAAYFIGCGVEWALAELGCAVAPYVCWSLSALVAPLGAWLSWRFLRGFLQVAREAKSDCQNGIVEVVEVHDAICIAQSEYNDEGPILFFDIGEGRVLLLWGQWLFDPGIYGAEKHVVAADAAAHINGQDGQYAFPSKSFTVYRTPGLGRVLKIDVTGERLEPLRTLPRGAVPVLGQRESELIDRSLDDLQAAATMSDRK